MFGVPRGAVARADVEQIELGIVGHRVPDGAAASAFPPLSRPGSGGLFQDRRFERLRRIARYGVKAPAELAAVGVIGRDVAAHAELGAAVADQHFAFDDARCTGDRVRLALIDRDYGPYRLAAGSVERD
jgi:hypothetical protein